MDFADNLALLSHTQQQMQTETTSVVAASAPVGLNIRKGKGRIPKYNTENDNPTTLDGETLEEVETSTYLGSIIDEQGGSDADVKARINKAKTISTVVEHMELKTTVNQHQSHNLQYERQDSSTVRS